MASENVKFCAKSRKRIAQQMAQQRVNSNVSLDTTAEIVPVPSVFMKRSYVPIREKQGLHVISDNTNQQLKQSDIGLSGRDDPDKNVGGAYIPKGRRIIDVAFFFEQVQELDAHSPRNAKCNFSTMECYKEIRRGLASYFFFKCTVCGFKKKIASSRSGTKSGVQDINAASVTASNKIGIGFNEADQFFASLGIPFLNCTEFEKQQKILKQKE